jgi:hypothetical protein
MSYSSRESYAAPLTPPTARGPDPRVAGQVSQTLAAGLAEVAGAFGGLWGRAQQAQQVNDATAIAAQKAMELVEMQNGFNADPDPAGVPDRFKQRAMEWRAQALEGLEGGVAGHVARQLDQMIPTAFRQVSADAHRRHVGNLRSGLAGTLGSHAQGLAGARDEPQLLAHLEGLKASIAGNVAAGVVTAGDTRPLFSNAVRQAITIAAATDPLRAQALLDRFKDEMDAGDVAALTTGLRAPVERRTVEDAATAAIAVPEQVRGRAQLIIDGLVARGLPMAAAVGLAANAIQESGARPDVQPGDGGRSDGLMQWNGPRREAFRARFGKDPRQATLDEQLDFVVQELDTTEARAGGAIRAATTPEDAARLASTMYLRPRDTAVEERRRAGFATALSGGSGREMSLADVRTRLADAPLHMRLSAESMVAQHYARQEAETGQQRAQLGAELRDLEATYQAGQTGAAIPEARIRALLPPDAAQRTIDGLTLARTAGDAVAAIAFASPGEIAEQRARLAPAEGDTYLAAERAQVLGRFDAALRERTRLLLADPAGFAAQAPEVRQLIERRAPQAEIATASLAAQERMGLRPAQMRMLSDSQVTAITETLRTTGPEKGDMAQTLAGLEQQFGPALWSRAFGELVQHGKIGWEWQAMAAMTAPAQAEGRAGLQAALKFMAERGGPEALRKLGKPDEVKQVGAQVDSAMSTFREAVRLHPGGGALFDTMRSAVETLTLWNIYRGQTASTAATNAHQSVIGARWDTAGDDGSGMFGASPTMLVPKGQGGKIETVLDRVRASLDQVDLAALPDPLRPDAPPNERRAATLEAARRGIWINNADASGAVLMARTPGGSLIALTRPGGAPIEVLFNRLPAETPQEAEQSEMDERARARAPRLRQDRP